MRKITKKIAVLLSFVMLTVALTACGSKDSGSKDTGKEETVKVDTVKEDEVKEENEKTDAVTGTWKQTDEMNGDWTWTFSGGSKAKLVGDTTGFESEGTYTLDEANKKLKVKLEGWSDEKEYDYTLKDDTLDLSEKYSSYHLIKQ